MLKTEHLWDFLRTTIGTLVCLRIINVARPDLINVSLTLGENTIIGIVPIISLVLAIGGIFFGGYVFCVYCEAIIHVAIEIIKNLRSSSRRET